jgi:hypothetical protein
LLLLLVCEGRKQGRREGRKALDKQARQGKGKGSDLDILIGKGSLHFCVFGFQGKPQDKQARKARERGRELAMQVRVFVCSCCYW